MSDRKTCSAYRQESGIYGRCRNGFPQTPACHGILGFYFPVPKCCDEEWCGRRYEQWGGKPPDGE